LTISSGDGFIYQLRLLIEGNKDEPELLWKLDPAADANPKGKGYNWFEGNVTLGPDGQYYAGNTNGNFYALDTNGKVRWTFLTKDMNGSAAAFDQNGALYIASLVFIFARFAAATTRCSGIRTVLVLMPDL
jgi:outer membrane protein assembly factor BamB